MRIVEQPDALAVCTHEICIESPVTGRKVHYHARKVGCNFIVPFGLFYEIYNEHEVEVVRPLT